jgi:FlaA1/EpsC-like NDP-sugar epimerase
MIKNYFTYYSQRFASKWVVLAIDLLIVLTTFLLTYVIRFNFTFQFNFKEFLVELPVVFAIASFCFLVVGSYKSVIRHTGFTDVMNLFKAISLMAFMTVFLVVLNRVTVLFPGFTIPLSIIVMHAIISFMALSASRLLFKILFRYVKCRFMTTKKIMIYGAGDSGMVTYNALVNNVNTRFEVVGLLMMPARNMVSALMVFLLFLTTR